MGLLPPSSWVLSNTPGRREPVVSDILTMQVLTAFPKWETEEGKGEIIPQSTPTPHCVDTRCQHLPRGDPGAGTGAARPLPRRGCASVCVSVCALYPVRAGRRTRPDPLPVLVQWCLAPNIPRALSHVSFPPAEGRLRAGCGDVLRPPTPPRVAGGWPGWAEPRPHTGQGFAWPSRWAAPV